MDDPRFLHPPETSRLICHMNGNVCLLSSVIRDHGVDLWHIGVPVVVDPEKHRDLRVTLSVAKYPVAVIRVEGDALDAERQKKGVCDHPFYFARRFTYVVYKASVILIFLDLTRHDHVAGGGVDIKDYRVQAVL